MTVLLRTTRIWGEDDYAVVDPDINKRVGRIYPTPINGEPKWLWFLQTHPTPPNRAWPIRGRGQASIQAALPGGEGQDMTAWISRDPTSLIYVSLSSKRP